MNEHDYFNILREDRQQMESRIAAAQQQSEARMSEKLGEYREWSKEQELRQNKKHEEFLRQEAERRAEQDKKHEEFLRRMDERNAYQDRRIDDFVQRISERMDSQDKRLDRMFDEIKASKWFILGTCVTVILGIAGMIVAFITAAPK